MFPPPPPPLDPPPTTRLSRNPSSAAQRNGSFEERAPRGADGAQEPSPVPTPPVFVVGEASAASGPTSFAFGATASAHERKRRRMTAHKLPRGAAVAAGATRRVEAASNGAKAEAVAAPCERPNRRSARERRSAFPGGVPLGLAAPLSLIAGRARARARHTVLPHLAAICTAPFRT